MGALASKISCSFMRERIGIKCKMFFFVVEKEYEI